MDKFELSWSSREEFEENIQAIWQDLELENDFYDVTLACADNQVKAHKVILSSGSSVLRNILKQNLNQNPVIYLKGLKHSDLQNLVTFIYQGKVTVPQEDLDNFLATAEDLKIKGLCKDNTIAADKKNVPFDKSCLDIQDNNKEINISMNEDYLVASEIEEKPRGNTNKTKFPDNFSTIVDKQEMDALHEIDGEATDQLEMATLVNINDENELDKDYIKRDENNAIVSYSNEMINLEYDSSEKDNNFHNISKLMTNNENVFNKDQYDSEGSKETNLLECNICDKKYVEKLAFKRHTSRVHEIVLHLCEQCDHQAPTKLDLDKHITLSHERIFHPCNQCDYRSSTKPKLKEHIKTIHERIKKFSCDQCDYKSNLNGNLKKHKKSIHDHIRYSCDQCDFSAAQKQRLVLHIRHQCKV